MTTYTFTGPHTQRQHKGTCPVCGKKVTRTRTFEHTVNPFNCTGEGDARRPKTWDEVRADVKAKADAWKPDFTCQACDFAHDLSELTVQTLLNRISSEGSQRYSLRRDGKRSRALLCNQRIAVYVTRVLELDPGIVDWPTSPYYNRQTREYTRRCYYEFPDGDRCVYSARHGAGFHLSPASVRAPIGGTT